MIAGSALIVSPWLLGFQDSDAMTIDVVIGAIAAICGPRDMVRETTSPIAARQ